MAHPEKAANLRALYTDMWAYPGKKLLFMGSEFGQAQEWNYNASLDWHLCQYMDHEGIRRLVADLNRLYASEPVLGTNDFNPHGFRWISCLDADANLIAYLRSDPTDQTLFVVVGHFGGATRSLRVGVPRRGWWKEVINSNSEYYGGPGLGNDGAAQARMSRGTIYSVDRTDASPLDDIGLQVDGPGLGERVRTTKSAGAFLTGGSRFSPHIGAWYPKTRPKIMARKISFINYKGGIGKTSLIVNTAAASAKMGKRVLLFDLDTQSNAST